MINTDILNSKAVLTVVLPCYNEKLNIASLVNEFNKEDKGRAIKRLIFVDDDSPDGTSEYIKNSYFPIEVLCLHRIGRQGLSSAVIEGVMLADTKYVAVMDADGQHSPKDLMIMLNKAESKQVDLVIGSRFKDVTSVDTHKGFRHLLSQMGNWCTSKMLNRSLSDPLTGFFLVERKIFVQAARKIKASGFKILLDLIYTCRKEKISIEEVQIDFRCRLSGHSKLDVAVVIEFIDQIINRFTSGLIPERFFSFSLVGLSGVFVHFSVLYTFIQALEQSFIISQSTATVVAMTSNYTLNNLITYRRNRRRGLSWLKGLVMFSIVCSLGMSSNIGVAAYLNNNAESWWLSALAGIFVGTIFNFVMSKFLVWRN
jgi:dolichol-phosphate mannosyltransferase